MKPIDLNLRCYQCGSRRLHVQAGTASPPDDPVFCQCCRTYLGRRSDIAFERRRFFADAANDAQAGDVAAMLPPPGSLSPPMLPEESESEPTPCPTSYR